MTRIKSLEEIEARHMRRAGAQPETPKPEAEPQLEVEADATPEDQPNGLEAELQQARQELAEMRHQMAALQGRLAPAQQQGDEYRRLYNDEKLARERERQELERRLEDIKTQYEQQYAQSSLEELLTDDERDMFDETQLNAIVKIADNIAQRRAPKVDVRAETERVLAEREAQRVKNYRDDFLADPQRGLADLGILAENPDFQQWLNQEENDDFEPLVRSFLNSKDKKEVDRLGRALARRVALYKESRRKPAADRKSDATTSHTGGLQRRPSQPSRQEVDSKLAEVKRLSRSRDPQDHQRAQEILDSLN